MNGLLNVVMEDHPSSLLLHGGSIMVSIDRRKCPATAIFQRFGLAPFRSILSSGIFAEAAKEAGCTPKRDRLLIPEVVAWLMMYVGLHTTSMTQGVTQAWGLLRTVCPWLGAASVSEEAFCQARKQLTLGFWRNLWQALTHRFEKRFSSSLLWKNTFRLLAVDGAEVDLPNAPKVAQFFGRPRNQRGQRRQPQAKLVSLCSVLTGFCFDFKLVGKRFTEHHALRHFVRRLRHNDLLLMDRGFFSLQGYLGHTAARRALPATIIQSTSWLR
jgi:hypothetical protein